MSLAFVRSRPVTFILSTTLAVVALAAPSRALAQEAQGEGEAQPIDPAKQKEIEAYKSIPWVEGPAKGELGAIADLDVPNAYHFTAAKGAKTMMELMHNPVSGKELGFVEPNEGDWFVVFEFSDIGYVKDDEKDKLDANAILESLKEGNEAANEERKEKGWGELHIVGWEQPPHYDPVTHNLEWAVRARTDRGEDVVNYNTRILGRGGVMEAALVVDPTKLQATIPQFKALLGHYDFKPEERYAAFRQGDKIAEYGLTALVTGGAVAVAAKTGILAKLGKGIIKLVAVAVAGLAGLAKKLFGKKEG